MRFLNQVNGEEKSINSHNKVVDTFQITGFIISIVISVGLIILKQDTIGSVILGLVLATLTQLFDLQIRNSASEKKLLQANTINQKLLYESQWLLDYIQQIVDDYVTVRTRNYELFNRRADDAIIDCRNTLHSMSEGSLYVEPQSPYTFGRAFKTAKHSIKQSVTQTNLSYWRKSAYVTKVLEGHSDTVNRGVGFVRIFIDPPEKLCEMLDILESHQEVGIDIYIAFPEDLPQSLHGNYIIIDDIAFAQLEFNANGEFSGQDISIDHIEVDRMIQKFDRAMEWAQELDEVKHILKQKKDVS